MNPSSLCSHLLLVLKLSFSFLFLQILLLVDLQSKGFFAIPSNCYFSTFLLFSSDFSFLQFYFLPQSSAFFFHFFVTPSNGVFFHTCTYIQHMKVIIIGAIQLPSISFFFFLSFLSMRQFLQLCFHFPFFFMKL